MAAVAGNVAVEEAAGILTAGGTVRAGASLERATARPPAGAGLESATVQVLMEPASRLVALQETEESNGARVKVAVVEPFKVAVRVTLWLFLTLPAVAVKVAEVAAAGTGMEVGMVKRGQLAVNLTVTG
jgi:hypothetical protein